MDTSERNFEESIEQWIVEQHFYYSRHPDNYDRTLCLDPEMVIGFIQATQPEEWQKLQAAYRRENAGEALLRRLASEVAERGVLDVLREDVKDRGVKFRLAYFVPSSGLNPDLQKKYKANHFSVIRRLVDGNKSLDMTLFLNGLPHLPRPSLRPLRAQRRWAGGAHPRCTMASGKVTAPIIWLPPTAQSVRQLAA